MPNVIVDRRLFLTASKDELVCPDDPAAAFLWATAGDEVVEAEARRVGYKPRSEAVAKQAEPVEDKAASVAEDKGGLTVNRRRKSG